jgi:hypothetical protein
MKKPFKIGDKVTVKNNRNKSDPRQGQTGSIVGTITNIPGHALWSVRFPDGMTADLPFRILQPVAS